MINKKILVLSILLSVLLNLYWYRNQIENHSRLESDGITRQLYIKPDTENESTLFQKFKFTKVAKIYFTTIQGDTISKFVKNIWTSDIEVLQTMPYYLPLDSVRYNRSDPSDFQYISEFNRFSTVSILPFYFPFGLVFTTVWFYFLLLIIKKVYVASIKKFQNKPPSANSCN